MNIFSKFITNYHSRDSFINKVRRRRIKTLEKMIADIHSMNGLVKILDIGGTISYWNVFEESFLNKNNVQITILNLNKSELTDANDSRFTEFVGDGCELAQFEDDSFDIVHSNSVIEHVGTWSRMVAFATESQRVGKSHFIQTPNFWFPIEPHFITPFFHWLPEPVRVGLLCHFSLGHFPKAADVDQAVLMVEGARLISLRMFRYLFPDSIIEREKILFITKSFVAVSCEKRVNS